MMERGWIPNVEISPNCPRCGSSNTKFCYYNNYSLTQPRYFCKGCRRYWTKGGSLRNVPVGGGCRKNRRGKSVRLSSDQAAVSSKCFHYGVGANNQTISRSYGTKVSNNSLDVNSSSSLMQDGSHIDLALVYANFLNQQPDARTITTTTTSAALELIIPEFPGELDPSLEFSSIDNTVQLLPEENGLVGCLSISDLSLETHLTENDQFYYRSAFDSVQKNDHVSTDHTSSNNNEALPIPPLPSEDQMASHHHEEILWLNSHMIVNHNSLEATQEQMLGPEDQVVQDPNLLFGNWSPFDFSSDDTFTKT